MAGGIFAVLAFIHFFVDFLFQSHSEAMIKHNHPKVRAKHCLIYAFGFLPLFLYCRLSIFEMFICFNILFWSHFYLDTYHFVFLWAKYVRQPPEMISHDIEKEYEQACLEMDMISNPTVYSNRIHDLTLGINRFKIIDKFRTLRAKRNQFSKEGFVQFVSTMLGKILLISIDQISHMSFLFPITYIIMKHI